MLKRRVILSVALALAAMAETGHAAIYKYVDRNGNITFSDQYRPGAVKLDIKPLEPVTVSTPRRHPGRHSLRIGPANFPKVDRATQRKRDRLRKTLLEEERAKERAALKAAREQLSAAPPRSPSKRGRLTESIRLHEKNIELLDRELAHVH